jgi:two-component system chemotaxis sensor kinase CheA
LIKPLGKVFQNVRGVGGFTILGNGQVSLLLDVPNLISQVARADDARRQSVRPTEESILEAHQLAGQSA